MANPNSSEDQETTRALQQIAHNIIGSTFSSQSRKRSLPESGSLVDQENPDSQSDAVASYAAFGRIFGRQASVFNSVDSIVNFGIKFEVNDDNDSDLEAAPLTAKEQSLLHGWKTLCGIIPGFRIDMLALAKQRSLRKTACQHISKGVTAVRSDDSASLKIAIQDYLLLDEKTPLVPPIQRKDKLKRGRGFCHPITASLLRPIKYPGTSQTYDDILAFTLPITAHLLPMFLFPDGHIYDPNDISDQVLRGHVMIRVAKHLFQGPSTACDEPGAHRGRQGNAALCGLVSMTPHTIAYVAIQARFAMSSATTWVPKEGTFSYEDFYLRVVSLFEDEEGEAILQYYNHHIFGTPSPDATQANIAQVDVEDEYELIQMQRAQKRARLAAAAVAAAGNMHPFPPHHVAPVSSSSP